MKICFIPIDNRPVCYNLAKEIAKTDENLTLYLPPRHMLGSLTKDAKIVELYTWLNQLPQVDAIVMSLDTIAYGGLIPSRRSPDRFEDIKQRLYDFKEILSRKNAKIYAVSSIMRISNNNCNEEEKEYWSKYGKKIFEYSYEKHKYASNLGLESPLKRIIPEDILNDYKQTRLRNFKINKMYLEWQKEGFFESLIFSKDDCAQYGYNVMEAIQLKRMGAKVITGADEIPLSLLAQAISGEIAIYPLFLEPDSKNLISNYEDVSIEKSVKNQIKFAGCKIAYTEDSADIILIVNNFKDHQGEIVMKVDTEQFNRELILPEKNYMIADVRNANGADNTLVDSFFKNFKEENFYGYSGWNTSSNTLGSLICCAKIKYLAKKYNPTAFKKVQMIRLLDDWAYQANIRQQIDKPTNISPLMDPYEQKVSKLLNLPIKNEYFFPWNRLFEIEVGDELY